MTSPVRYPDAAQAARRVCARPSHMVRRTMRALLVPPLAAFVMGKRASHVLPRQVTTSGARLRTRLSPFHSPAVVTGALTGAQQVLCHVAPCLVQSVPHTCLTPTVAPGEHRVGRMVTG